MMGSTISSTSAAITSPPASIEPPGPKLFRPGPRSPAWPLGHKPSCALSRPEPNQVDGAAAAALVEKSEIVSHLPPTSVVQLAAPSTPKSAHNEVVRRLEAREPLTPP